MVATGEKGLGFKDRVGLISKFQTKTTVLLPLESERSHFLSQILNSQMLFENLFIDMFCYVRV